MKQLPPYYVCSSSRELAVLFKCEAVAGSQNENQLSKDTVLCKYQQLQSIHYIDLCIHQLLLVRKLEKSAVLILHISQHKESALAN